MKISRLNPARLAPALLLGVALAASAQITGFGGSGTGWTLNGAPAISNNVLTIVNGYNNANSVFYNTRQNINGFTASFVWQNAIPVGFNGGIYNPADGMVFTLQTQGSNAVGGVGASLGYDGISSNTGVAFNLYPGHTVGLGYAPNSTGNNSFIYQPTGAVNFDSTDPIAVNIIYNNTTKALSVSVTDTTTVASSTAGFTVDLVSDAGGATAFVGFTGGSASGESMQTISNFTFAPFVAPAGGSVITNNLPANAAIINISGTEDGAASYNGDQSLWYQPFYTGSSTNLLEYTVQPGTYNFRIVDPADASQIFPNLTSAQTSEIFTAWTYNSPWTDDYLVFPASAATNNAVSQLFDGAPGPGFSNGTSVQNANEAYSDAIAKGYYNLMRIGPLGRDSTILTNTYTFTNAQTLIFAVPDNGLSDNAGGVSVAILPISDLPAIIPLGSQTAYTNAIHLVNDAGQDAVSVLNGGSPFVTDFKGESDVAITKLFGTAQPDQLDTFGGIYAANNPYYITNFVGFPRALTGDGTPGDIKDLSIINGVSLEFDFASHFTPNDRLLMIDADKAEQYQVQAFVKTGFSYTQVPLTGWVVSNYAGSTLQAPVTATWPTWNPATGILASPANPSLNEDLVVLVPDQAVDRVIISQIAGAGQDGANLQFIGNVGPLVAPLNQNVLVNGDFSAGNTGFSSGYTFVPSGQSPNPGTYGIRTNSQDFNSGFTLFYDHTSGNGNMMLVDGSGTPNTVVWSETVPVAPFTQYLFSYWAASDDSPAPASLQAMINGQQTGQTNSLPATAGLWQQFQITWNSGTNTSATLAIVDQNLVALNNDFALDDLSFMAVTGGVPLANQTVQCGSPASFTVQATGPAPLTYQWWVTGTGGVFYALGGATNANLTFPYVDTRSSGLQCYVVASSPYGSVTSPVATVTVVDTAPPVFQLGQNQVNPQAALTAGTNGNFYGTTSGGGAHNLGSVYEVTPSGVLTTLYSFTGGGDGSNPMGALALGTNGNFYGTAQNGGTNTSGTIFEITHAGVLMTLTGSFGDGNNPSAGLTLGRDGNFYGVTEFGGTNGGGTIFKATPDGTVTTLHDLSQTEGIYPQGGLLPGSDGNFYGTANESGQGYGTVFKITPAGVLTTLYSFLGGSDGSYAQGALAQGINGDIYGVTLNGGTNNSGTIFQITPSGVFTSLYAFSGNSDGSYPAGGLVAGADGNIYGVTEYASLGGGAIFVITPSGAFTTLYQFYGANNGAGPTTALFQGSDGNFYGTTAYSGLYGNGTVFRITPSGILNTLASFQPSSAITVECHTPFNVPTANDTCAGSVPTFLAGGSVDTNTPGIYTVSYGATGSSGISITNTFVVTVVDTTPPTILPVGGNGFNPNSGLIAGPGGNFYGTTQSGGIYNHGTVFVMSPLGLVTNIYSFTGTNDGGSPAKVLLYGADGNFYGGTTSGGSAGVGTIFKLTPSGVLTTLYQFTGGVDGGGFSGLVVGNGAGSSVTLYGTTEYGGTNSEGSVFSLSGAGAFTTIYSFAYGNDGGNPVGLTLGSNSDFYGAAENAGAGGSGTVFQVTPSGVLTTLYAFTNGADGGFPCTSLVQGTNGDFYGFNHSGGTYGDGTLFAVSPSGSFNALYSFTNNISSEFSPATPFVLGNDGNFYGVTLGGGSSGAGTVFKLTESGQFNTLGSLNYSDGDSPMGVLATGPGGNFFGTAFYGGSSGNGTAFEITPSGSISALAAFGGGITLTCGAHFTDPGATVYDTCAGTNLQITVSGAVNTSKPGVYVLQYFATDPATNTGYYYRPVTVLDTAAPTLVLNGGSVVNVVLGTSFADPGASAIGACGETNTVIVSGTVNVNVAGDYLVTYIGTTANGLTVTNSRIVVVSTNLQSTACVPPPSGLAAWWPGENNTLDIIGGDDGSLQNGASYGLGLIGSAFNFGGSNQAVIIPYSPAIDLTILPAWTIEAWVNPASFDNSQYPTVYADGDVDVSLGLNSTTGAPESWIQNNQLVGSIPVPMGEWSHLALTYDGTNRTLYVNGLVAGTDAPQAITPPTADFAIGGVASLDPGHSFNGLIDEVSVYNRALSASEITAIYDAASLGKCHVYSPPSVAAFVPVMGAVGNVVTITGSGFLLTTNVSFNGVAAQFAVQSDGQLVAYVPAGVATGPITVSGGSGTTTTTRNFTLNNAPACDPAPSGIIGWWPGEGNADDVLGLPNGSLNAGATFAPGLKGLAFSFDGVSNFVDLGSVNLASTWTIEAWVNPSALPAGRHTIAGGVGLCSDWAISFDDAQFGVRSVPPGGCTQSTPAPLTPVIGTWYHVAATCDGANASIYVDGVLQNFAPVSSSYQAFTNDFVISSENCCGGDHFAGLVDELAVYNRALSPAEIAALYNAGAAGKCVSSSTVAISLQANPAAGGSVSGAGTFPGGSTVTVTATPSSQGHWAFLDWTENGFVLSSNPVYSFTANSDHSLVANFIGATNVFTQQPQPASRIIEAGSSVSFTASVVSPAPLQFQWYLAGAPLSGATNSSLYLTNVLLSQGGAYTLVARNSFGLVTSASATLFVVVTSVKITSPANGLSAFAPASFSLNATASDPNGITGVNFYTNGVFCGQSSSSPYQFLLTGLSAGSYALTAVAVDSLGLMGTSLVVHVTVNNPGSTLIDFEALDASSGAVGGAALSNYLAGFGVGVTGITPASASLAVADDRVFLGGAVVKAASGDNFLVETGAGGAVSYTLFFSKGYASVGWVRPKLPAGTTGAALPAWRATMFDNTGKPLGSVGEAARVSYADIGAAPFTALGPNIYSIRFDGNSGGASPLATLPLDDLLLSTTVVNTTLQVGLASGAGSVLSAPGTVVLNASVSDTAGTVSSVQFYQGSSLAGTAALAGGAAALTLQNLAAGSYTFTAVAGDSLGAVRSSAPLTVTVAAVTGLKVINFDALDTTGGSVGGAGLSNYLAGFGVKWSNVTVGTALEAVNAGGVTGAGGAVASSPPNYFTQEGLSTPVSFTLAFSAPVQAFGFARAGLVAGAGGVSHPQWTATMLGADGTALGSAGEALLQSATNVPARTFVLSGAAAISAVRFDSDSQKVASFSAVLLDDLILNANAGTAALSVTLLPPVVSGSAPVNLPLTANVTDNLGVNYSVSFYAGPNLIGSVSGAPYALTWNNVLAGTYVLRAQVTDASGLAVYSAPVTVTVNAGGQAQVVNFDRLNATAGPVTGNPLSAYLAPFGMTVGALSPGTTLAVENQGLLANGGLVAASSPPNVVTQIGSNGPVSYTVSFGTLLSSFGFTRPELLAAPFASHPAWTVTAYDGAGVVVGQAGEGAIASYTNVGARAFNLTGPGIASAQFASQGTGLGALNGMVADDFVLTTNAAGTPFPPAVAVTAPGAGLQLTGVVALPVTAVAADAAGVTGVGFYASGLFIGSAVTPPYSVQWTNSGPGGYLLTAVATNQAGLVRTSPAVSVSVLPPADQFGIASQPVSQTVATGSTATFTVGTTGTSPVTYQWFQNGNALGGQTASSLVLSPVGNGNVGTYTVQVSSGGATLASAGAVLQVLDPPTFTVPPAGVTVAAGTDILLTNQVDGDGPLTWQWLLNGTSIAGATNKNYTIAAAQPLSSGQYQVVAANPVAFSVSAVAPVTVTAGNGQLESADDFADRISINPLLGAVAGNSAGAPLAGELTQIAGKPVGRIIWYTWQAGFTGVISLTTLGSDFDTLLGVYTGNSVAALTPVAADDDSGGYFTSLVTFNVAAGTNYQIAVGGFQGASGNVILGMPAGTGYRVLSAGPGGSVPVITQPPASQLVQAGAKVTLSVTATGAQSYQWLFQGAPIAGGTGSSLVLTNFQAGAVGLYNALAANAAGSVQSEAASVQIAVVNQAGVVETNAAHDKFGDAVDLAGNAAKAVEPVTPASGGGDTRGFSISQTFSTVGATKEPGEPDPCGQAGGASQWYVYTAPAAGTLHVSTTGSSFNTILAVYTGPGTNFASLAPQACGYTTNFQTQGQPGVVVPNVVKGTRYFIVVDGYQGATGRAQLQVGLGSAPSLVTPPANQFVTAGSNATFSVGAVGSANLTYQWQLNGANLARATGASLTVTNAQTGAVGSYTVVVSNVVGVVTSAPPAVLVLQYAPGITKPPTNESVTLGQKGGFSVGAAGVNTKSNPFLYQWYFDGAPVSKAAGPALAFTASQWTNNGSYQVVVSNTFGAATSAVAVLTVRDPAPPTVTITNPAVNNFTIQTNQVTVSGAAADNVGLQAVRVQVNNNGFQTAAGSNHWTILASLVPGTNIITAQAVDLAGNTNTAPVRRNIIYLVSSTLTVLTNGVGGVTSADGATNGATLVLGRNYLLTAAVLPKTNWLFDHWSSGAADLGNSNRLTFTMASNLVIEANFVTNPFPALAGTYNGLFYPSNGVTEASSGFFTASVVSNGAGAYTAQLMLDGVTYHNATGLFTPAGQSQWIIPRSGRTPVTVALNLDLTSADNQLTGTVSNAAWTSVLQADRAVFNAATAPATNYNGQYTLLLPPGAGAPQTQPDGYGYAAISNSLGGISMILGALADGTPFSQSVAIAQDGSIPLYASLYSQKGTLLGWITFTNQPPKTLSGSVNWIKPAQAKTLYPQGFTNLVTQVLGSAYTNATLTGGPALDLPQGTLTLTNGNLASNLFYYVGLNTNNLMTNQIGGASSTNHLAIIINPVNGVLTVTFQAPGAKTNTIGHGAVLQNQTNAFGAFPGPTQSGAILLK